MCLAVLARPIAVLDDALVRITCSAPNQSCERMKYSIRKPVLNSGPKDHPFAFARRIVFRDRLQGACSCCRPGSSAGDVRPCR